MTWFPASAALDRWLEVYCAVAEANGGEPDAGSHLRSWAHRGRLQRRAGVGDRRGATPTDDERAWWGGLWADRVLVHRPRAPVPSSWAWRPKPTCAAMADGWRAWAATPDAWFAVLHGEVLATP